MFLTQPDTDLLRHRHQVQIHVFLMCGTGMRARHEVQICDMDMRYEYDVSHTDASHHTARCGHVPCALWCHISQVKSVH